MGKIGVLALLSVAGLSAIAWALAAGAPGRAEQRAAESAAASASGAMLPPRLLDCRLGRITNFDPSREQKPSEYIYEGEHAVRLFLPAIPVRTAEPPRSTEAPDPVDPQTRIVADPDGIAAGAIGHGFDRVVDYWPERVEMTTPVGEGQVNLIVLQKSAEQPGMTDIFMTKARDAVTFDQAHLYSGRCTAITGEAALQH